MRIDRRASDRSQQSCKYDDKPRCDVCGNQRQSRLVWLTHGGIMSAVSKRRHHYKPLYIFIYMVTSDILLASGGGMSQDQPRPALSLYIWYLINGHETVWIFLWMQQTLKIRNVLDSRSSSAGRSSYGRGFFNFVFLFFAFDVFGLLFPFAIPAEHPRIRMTLNKNNLRSIMQ